MSIQENEREQVLDEHRDTPTMTSPTSGPTPQPSVSPSSLIVPGLGSGERREQTSGELLTELAVPQILSSSTVFPGPEFDVQRDLVDRLEASVKVNWKGFSDNPALLYLGSVVLNSVPSKEKEQEFIDSARLEKTTHALGSLADGYDVAMKGGADRAIIRNTLQTMIATRQMDYLRKSGIIGDRWSVVVEVHYYRERPKNAINTHKDTLGQTLFVNLNYLNPEPIPGPEVLVNPPLVPTHEDKLRETLPPGFRDDLAQTRALPIASEYVTGMLPANGIVSFVDEAVHHATPMLEHRKVPIADFRTFVSTEDGFRTRYDVASTAWSDSHPKGLWKLGPRKAFSKLFGKKAPDATEHETELWEGIMELLHGDLTHVSRPELLEAGMSPEQILRLITRFGPTSHSAVKIPSRARADRSEDAVPMMDPRSPEHRLPLKRQMSTLGTEGRMPVDPGGKRAFFRTWVRAVPNPTPAPSVASVASVVSSLPPIPVAQPTNADTSNGGGTPSTGALEKKGDE